MTDEIVSDVNEANQTPEDTDSFVLVKAGANGQPPTTKTISAPRIRRFLGLDGIDDIPAYTGGAPSLLQIAKIVIHFAPSWRGHLPWMTRIYNSSDVEIGRIENTDMDEHDYSMDPADTTVLTSLAAYLIPDQCTLTYQIGDAVYAETDAAHAALPSDTTIKKPLNWMLNSNYYYWKTHDGPIIASDVVPGSDRIGFVHLYYNHVFDTALGSGGDLPDAPSGAIYGVNGWHSTGGIWQKPEDIDDLESNEARYIAVAFVGTPPQTIPQDAWTVALVNATTLLQHADTRRGTWSYALTPTKDWIRFQKNGEWSPPVRCVPKRTNNWKLVGSIGGSPQATKKKNTVCRIRFADFQEVMIEWSCVHASYASQPSGGRLERYTPPYPVETLEEFCKADDSDAGKSTLLIGGTYGTELLWGWSGTLPGVPYPDNAMYVQFYYPDDDDDDYLGQWELSNIDEMNAYCSFHLWVR